MRQAVKPNAAANNLYMFGIYVLILSAIFVALEHSQPL